MFFTSPQKKMQRTAENWLRLAEKVYHYRCDLLKDSELNELAAATGQLRESLRKKEDAARLRIAAERMEDVLRKYGGAYYQRSGWTENIEVLLVAAILAIGIRTYFIQPFKIPTNSMWPTYFGMTHEVYTDGDDQPGKAAHLFRRVAFGAKRYSVKAPVSGEIQLAVQMQNTQPYRPYLPIERTTGRKWVVWPTPLLSYRFYVGDSPVQIAVPPDFQMESVFLEAFFPDSPSLEAVVREALTRENLRPGGEIRIGTGRTVQAGESALEFDILTGDQLFVDRMSYHFKHPKIGDGFVFRTGDIAGLNAPDGTPDDKYYIKRLVGIPGDTLQIDTPVLLRNGEPISGKPVFEKLNQQEGRYTGYVAMGMLEPGRKIEVPEDSFFALGDNSPNSLDSRAWGYVPANAVVGRSLFIYYPFTKRWGPAR